ncbi:MAG: alpha/beta hydrolase [Actinomycetota bacterium]|nr:alpha/beta hydrolase [Actinomycetota bacterium]
MEEVGEILRSFDKTELAAVRLGTDEGLPLMVVNAIGADLTAWRRVLVDVVRERPVIAWDHRGLHASGPPISGRVDVEAHAEDAIGVLDHFDVQHCAIVAWSSGTRIALEIAGRYPEAVRCMFLVSGAHGSPWTALLRMEFGAVLPRLAAGARFVAGPLGAAFRRLAERPELPGLVRQSGMVGATADTQAIVELVRAIAECDFALLLRAYGEVMSDVADDVLDEVRAPAAIVIGDRDPYTSRAAVEQLAQRLSDATVDVYEGATHYLPLEFPAKLSVDLRRFLAAHANGAR